MKCGSSSFNFTHPPEDKKNRRMISHAYAKNNTLFHKFLTPLLRGTIVIDMQYPNLLTDQQAHYISGRFLSRADIIAWKNVLNVVLFLVPMVKVV